MAECSYCGKLVSTSATHCPNCGERDPGEPLETGNDTPGWAFLVGFTLMPLGAYLGWKFGSTEGALMGIVAAVGGFGFGSFFCFNLLESTDRNRESSEPKNSDSILLKILKTAGYCVAAYAAGFLAMRLLVYR